MDKVCGRHPRYKAIREPRSGCLDCLYAWQRKTRGFDDSETWSLDASLARWLAPRLRRFIEVNAGGHPPQLTSVEWEGKLREMLYAFEFLGGDERWLVSADDSNWQRCKAGLDEFHEWLHQLWW